MLAAEVFFYQQRIHRELRINQVRETRHLSHLFHHDRIVYSIVRIFSPSKRSVILHQNTRCMYRIQAFKATDDHFAGFPFVSAFHFFGCHIRRTGNCIMEVIGMCCSDIRNIFASLCPGSRKRRMSMHNPTYFRKSLIQYNMCRRITRRIQIPFYYLSFQIDYYHIFCFHGLIRNSAGLDNNQPAFPVDGRHVSPGKNDQTMFHQV